MINKEHGTIEACGSCESTERNAVEQKVFTPSPRTLDQRKKRWPNVSFSLRSRMLPSRYPLSIKPSLIKASEDMHSSFLLWGYLASNASSPILLGFSLLASPENSQASNSYDSLRFLQVRPIVYPLLPISLNCLATFLASIAVTLTLTKLLTLHRMARMGHNKLHLLRGQRESRIDCEGAVILSVKKFCLKFLINWNGKGFQDIGKGRG